MLDKTDITEVPQSHLGWSVEVKKGLGAYGPETVQIFARKGEASISAIAWTEAIAWQSLREMIRRREDG